jgi:hypothetical protein
MRLSNLASLVCAALLALLPPCARAITVDGIVDPAEWEGAQRITDFRLTQPLSRAPAPYPTEALILATPEGLAIGFRNTQPPGVRRTRQVAARDVGAQADRVNLYIDFNGDGRTGYNFTILLSDSIIDATITNENQFSTDWDGIWKHAVHEDEQGWSAEMLIPWYIAPMSAGKDGKRTLGISLDRVLGATGERMSWPAVGFTEARFLSRFAQVVVPEYTQSLLAVTPYVTSVYDNVGKAAHFDTGADVFWKPNSHFQLSATLNPDFGQVESDQLVVNFSAVESFFSDKRPFFTENQSFFDVPFGGYNPNNRLIYTRRVGGTADDGSGAGDVTAAVKLNGNVGGFNYGAFAATEADEVGRDFYAVRGTRDFDTQGVGAMVTRVDRPFLDRTATVYEFDHRWVPTDRISLRTTLVESDVDQSGANARDNGVQLRYDQDFGNGWRQNLYAVHLGKDLQLNDFGYLERNDFNYARYEVDRRYTDLSPASSYASHEMRYAASIRYNDDGQHLVDVWAIDQVGELRNGGNDLFEVAEYLPGYDDRITRGNGIVRMPTKAYLYYERFTPRQKNWSLYWHARYAAEGLEGPAHGAMEIDFNPTYFFSDNLALGVELFAQHNPDWLLWPDWIEQDGRLLGSFRSDWLQLSSTLQWTISAKQELRVKLESIALNARLKQAWRVADDGTPVATDEPIPDFSLRNLGFQIRYRYELAPLSNLYIAYVRGGYGFNDFSQDVGSLLGDAFSLRDSEQLLVKLSYRFEL